MKKNSTKKNMLPSYPTTPTKEVVDMLHGQSVADPYRWLEDGTAPEVKEWVNAQNTYTHEYLNKIPAREYLKKRFTELLYTPSFSVPVPKKGKYFFTERKENEDLVVLYVQEGLHGEPRALVNLNLLPKEKRMSLHGWSPSRDGKLIAYGLSEAGNDQTSIYIMNVETGEQLPDTIPAEVYPFTPNSWEPDGTGFWYTRRLINVPKGEEKFYRKVYYHHLGDNWENDELVFGENIKKEDWPHVSASEDGRHIIASVDISSEQKKRTEVFLFDRQNKARGFVPIIKNIDGLFSASIHRNFIYITTNFEAPYWKIMRVPIKNAHLEMETWETVVQEKKGEVVEASRKISDHLFVAKTENVVLHLYQYTLDGTLISEIPLPAIGDITGHTGESEGNELIFGFTSFLTPHMVFRFDIKTSEFQKIREAPGGIDSKICDVKQTWYPSKDGTKIPMFLVHKKDGVQDGNNPVYLYGYGGLWISKGSTFNKHTVDFINRGGIYVIAHIRGGGELGEEWHDAGRRENKQNVFDDFIAAAEWLIKEKYTSSNKLVISGWSNGGLLTSAVMIQRPELFRAVIIGAPVTDMLRFHLFFGGRHWIPEYGDPGDPKIFPHLLKYSPYHNIKDGVHFPAVLILTAEQDDRVHPMHAYKIAARIQAVNDALTPILIRIETKAGHSGVVAVNELIERQADVWTFIFEQIGWGDKK